MHPSEEQNGNFTRVPSGKPTVALRGMTVLPGLVIHFDLSRTKSILAVEQAMMSDQRVFLVGQKDVRKRMIRNYTKVYHMGCLAQIKQVTRLPENVVRVLVEGLDRAIFARFSDEEKKLSGRGDRNCGIPSPSGRRCLRAAPSKKKP